MLSIYKCQANLNLVFGFASKLLAFKSKQTSFISAKHSVANIFQLKFSTLFCLKIQFFKKILFYFLSLTKQTLISNIFYLLGVLQHRSACKRPSATKQSFGFVVEMQFYFCHFCKKRNSLRVIFLKIDSKQWCKLTKYIYINRLLR